MQPALFAPAALSVSDLTRYLRELIASDEILRDVWVQGEISNLSRPSSGHIYFVLKDQTASLRCVIWRSTALRLRTDLQNGLAVEAHGEISVYERDGQYQLYVDALRLAGEGRLYQEFLRLKARLEAEGLFDEGRKRPIPTAPRTIGMVTSATGAALQDMLNTLGRRYPLARVVLAPAAVQGDDAPPQVVAALQALNALGEVDVIIVARGGGSLEDLWCFNDERVVRAIAASGLPVICGIGHETDFTLADFAADLRAPTPTAAAVAAAPDISEVRADLRALAQAVLSSGVQNLGQRRAALAYLKERLRRASPLWRIHNDRQRLDQLDERLQRAFDHHLALRRERLAGLSARLYSLDPRAVLQRGYAVLRRAEGGLVSSVEQVAAGQNLHAELADGSLDVKILDIIMNIKR